MVGSHANEEYRRAGSRNNASTQFECGYARRQTFTSQSNGFNYIFFIIVIVIVFFECFFNLMYGDISVDGLGLIKWWIPDESEQFCVCCKQNER